MTPWTDADWPRISRHLAGETTAEEAAALRHWIDADPARRSAYDELERGWHAVQPRMRTWESERHWNALQSAIQKDARKTAPSFWGRHSVRLGVALGLIVLVVGTLYPTLSHIGARTGPTQRYTTTAGQRATVRLPNGSTVVLAPSTSVAVAQNTMQVIGETYFAIAPTSHHASMVQTSKAMIHILGTRFVVRDYPNETHSHVLVDEGKVSVHLSTLRNANRAPVLSSGTLAVITDSGMTITPDVISHDYAGWMQGVLTFERAPLADVIAELSRAYGPEIRIMDTTLANAVLHLDISVAHEPLEAVLEHICNVTGAHYTARRIGERRLYLLLPGRAAIHDVPSASFRHQLPHSEFQYGR